MNSVRQKLLLSYVITSIAMINAGQSKQIEDQTEFLKKVKERMTEKKNVILSELNFSKLIKGCRKNYNTTVPNSASKNNDSEEFIILRPRIGYRKNVNCDDLFDVIESVIRDPDWYSPYGEYRFFGPPEIKIEELPSPIMDIFVPLKIKKMERRLQDINAEIDRMHTEKQKIEETIASDSASYSKKHASEDK